MRAAGLWLALTAICLRALVPAGYMIGEDASHRVAVTLCGGMEGVVDLATGKFVDGAAPHSDHAKSDGAHCPFALAQAPVTPVDAFAAPVRPEGATAAVTHWRVREERVALAGPPLPARGPPQQT